MPRVALLLSVAPLLIVLLLFQVAPSLPRVAPKRPPLQESPRRPVVLVHGFGATARAWENYLGGQGFLAGEGLQGFAVGDGQVEGTMNTGNLLDPSSRTNTIAENARILGEYIENVKRVTGAEQVDLIAHSMGGLISRYYIARVMKERDVAQLIMLGSPQLGTDCANLPAAAGLFLPATLELRPAYVMNIFNRQITERHGVPFYILSGIPIEEPIQSPCTSVPSDIVISQASATGIPATVSYLPVLHTDLNLSREVFEQFVKPLLLRPTEEISDEPDSVPPGEGPATLQFSRVFSGHLEPGESEEITIHIDAVSVASFALFDPTRTLTVTVTGASGQVIDLSPTTHALTVIDDPASLLYLGYGFNNPRPGPWKVMLQTTGQTPATGAEYGLTAQYVGGPTLDAETSLLLPAAGEEVELSALLSLDGEPRPIEEALATIRSPAGTVELVRLDGDSGPLRAIWVPDEPGLYSIDIEVRGRGADGAPLERAAFLAVEAQPASRAGTLVVLAIVGLVTLLAVGLFLRRRATRARIGSGR